MKNRFRFVWGKSYAKVFERDEILDVSIENGDLIISVKGDNENMYKNWTFRGDYEDVESAFNAFWDWMDKCDDDEE